MFFKFVNNFEPSLAGSHNPLRMGTINTIAACEPPGMYGCIDLCALPYMHVVSVLQSDSFCCTAPNNYFYYYYSAFC